MSAEPVPAPAPIEMPGAAPAPVVQPVPASAPVSPVPSLSVVPKDRLGSVNPWVWLAILGVVGIVGYIAYKKTRPTPALSPVTTP